MMDWMMSPEADPSRLNRLFCLFVAPVATREIGKTTPSTPSHELASRVVDHAGE